MDLYGRLLHDVLFPGFEAYRGRPTVGLMRYLDRTQWASADELHAIQTGLLRRMLRHAYRHTVWYRRAFAERGLTPDDIRGPEDLHKLPLLEKDLARGSSEERTSTAPPFAVVHKATSGSTGQPMMVAYNAESRYWRDATRWRGYGWAGYRPGMKALHYWGAPAVPPKELSKRLKIAVDRAMNRNLYLDCTLRGEAEMAAAVEAIARYRPEVLVTYSQAGAELARHVIRTGTRRWGEIAVLVGAERLFPHDRAVLEEAFGPTFETYGSREFMLTGSECEVHDGLHTSMETMITELVVRNPDGTTRAAQPGERAEVVITDLHNLAVPFIRYVNSDLAVARAPDRCACGRWLHRIGPIEGRVMETLRDGRGGSIGGSMWPVLFLYLIDWCTQYQVVQHPDDRITIKMVMAPGATLPPDKVELIRNFCAKYVGNLPVAVEQVDDIPAGPSGKRRLVIVEPPAAARSQAAR